MYLLHRKRIDIYANISLFLSYSEVTAVTRSSPYPDQMVDQHLEMTSTALNVSRDQDPRWAPETDPQWRPRHLDSHREKTTGTSWALTIWLCSSWNWTAGLSGQRRIGPLTEPGFSQGFFSPFCHLWSFGSLPLSPLACLVGDTSFPAISSTWLNRNFLNWTELNDASLNSIMKCL